MNCPCSTLGCPFVCQNLEQLEQHKSMCAFFQLAPLLQKYNAMCAQMPYMMFKRCLKNANLQNVSFEREVLENYDFSFANLQGANFDHAKLKNAIVLHANMSGASLQQVSVDEYFKFEQTQLTSANIAKSFLRKAQFVKCNLEQANIVGCALESCTFDATSMSSANVQQTEFVGAKFSNCNLNKTKFENCDFTRAQFENCTMNQVMFVNCKMNGTVMRKCNVTSGTFQHVSFAAYTYTSYGQFGESDEEVVSEWQQVDAQNAKFEHVDWSKAIMMHVNMSNAQCDTNNMVKDAAKIVFCDNHCKH